MSSEKIWFKTSEGDTERTKKLNFLMSAVADTQGAQGIQGEAGTDGRGIISIIRTSGNGQEGTDDTYTITYTDSTTDLFVIHNGNDGINGINGSNGASAYQVAIANGFVGTEAQWLVSLKGATGLTGAQGIQGIQGVKGETGDDGRGIISIIRTSGNGSAGTTDIYTITYSDATTSTFNVYNGADGLGSGDMLKSIYDTNNSGVVDSAESVAWAGVTDKPTIPTNIDDLVDVVTNTPSDGQVLTWDSSTSKWVNETPTTSGSSTNYGFLNNSIIQLGGL